MVIQESGEMYLETIYILSRQSGSVRSIDVAEHLGYSKPSVSRAVGRVRANAPMEANWSQSIQADYESRKR